jgi:hypothetical protein
VVVFADRWLGSGLLTDLSSPIHCRWSFACLGAWPGAVVVIVMACLAAILLVALWRPDTALLQTPRSKEGVAPSRPGAGQRRFALVMLAATGLTMIAVLAARTTGGNRPGWDYAIPLLGFLAAWAVSEVPVGRILPTVSTAAGRWAAPLGTHLLLVLTIWASVDRRSGAVGLAILALGAHLLLWRTRRRTLTPAFWLVSLNLAVTSLYFLGWWFSAIGDEYAFYDFATRLLNQATTASIGEQLFNPAAVYAAHPGFSSLIQIIGMAVFGPGLFGWRFTSLYLAALSLWPFYAFVESIGGRRLAVLAGVLLACSHYLMSFGKIGYNNLQALFTFAACLAAAAWFLRSETRSSAVALGAALGLCFYVYPGALLTIPVTVLFAVQTPFTPAVRRRWLLVGLVLLACALPIVLQRGFWETKAAGTLWEDPSFAGRGPAAVGLILRNLGQASLSFLLTPAETHFVAIGFVDVVTAVLVIIGFGALLRSGSRRTRVYFLVSLAILLVLVGALHGYASPPATRMFLLLPWLAILGGVGLLWLESAVRGLGASERAAYRVTAILLGIILTVNLFQAYPLSRLRMASRYQSPQVLLLREADHLLEPGANRAYLLILARADTPLRESIARQLTLHHVPFAEASLEEQNALEATAADLQDPRSLVWIAPRVPEERRLQLEASLRAAGKAACRFRSSIGEVRLEVWVAPPERHRCAEAPYRW